MQRTCATMLPSSCYRDGEGFHHNEDLDPNFDPPTPSDDEDTLDARGSQHDTIRAAMGLDKLVSPY